MNNKILVPIKTSDELPDKTGVYLTSSGEQTFNKEFNRFCVNRNVKIWYKEVTQSELLKEYAGHVLNEKMPSDEEMETKILNIILGNISVKSDRVTGMRTASAAVVYFIKQQLKSEKQ